MEDLGCDWICDECGAYMNNQQGFIAGGSWTCAACGGVNDVSDNNILAEEDGYVGSYQYYEDEEARRREIEEDERELGIID